PVKLPAGRARLATAPISMGSLTAAKTTGSVVPVCLTATTAGVFVANSTATGSRTRSAASSGSRSTLPRAQRYSMAMFWPSTQPCSRNPSRNAWANTASVWAEPEARNPIRGHVPGLLRPGVMDVGQEGEGDHDEGSDAFFPHGVLPLPDAFRHVLSPILVKPNAAPHPRLKAGAQ